MFKKRENGFSLVELSVAAAVAIGLAVVAVAVVSGTASSVSSKGTSAASVETCTISEALAKSGGDEAATDCGAAGASSSPSASTSAAAVPFGTPTTQWHMWFANRAGNQISIMGGQGTISPQGGDYCLACGVGDGASQVGGLNGWGVKIGNSNWLTFNIKEMADGMIFDDGSQWGTWDFMTVLYSVHGISTVTEGTQVQLKAPNGTYSNVYTMPYTATYVS